MTKRRISKMVMSIVTLALALVLVPSAPAQTEEQGAAIDILRYKINAELIPDSHTLKATATVTFKPLKQTQSAVLEMNGSLIISSVKGPDGKTALQFIQDRVNDLNVKINLGQLYQPGSEITLTFEYAGPLATPEGGPVPDRRLAYIGPEGSYLFYASRWFPFHGYAADRVDFGDKPDRAGQLVGRGPQRQPRRARAYKRRAKDFYLRRDTAGLARLVCRRAVYQSHDKYRRLAG